MTSRAAALVLPALLLAACNTGGGPGYPPPPAHETPPPPPPPGGIQGHGAYRLSSGARVSCAGYSVALMPDVGRYRRRMDVLYGVGERVMQPVSDVKARSAKLPPSPDTAPIASASCDARGEFAFADLAPGGFILIAHVRIKPAAAGHDDFAILQHVTVRPGQVETVSLAP